MIVFLVAKKPDHYLPCTYYLLCTPLIFYEMKKEIQKQKIEILKEPKNRMTVYALISCIFRLLCLNRGRMS